MVRSRSAFSRSLIFCPLEDLHAPSSQKTEEEIYRWVPSIELLFTLVRSMFSIGWAELATDLGFGVTGLPDLADPPVMALQKKVYGDRGKETREAVPIPLELVASSKGLW